MKRPCLKFLARPGVVTLSLFSLTTCQTVSRHQFASPAPDWQTRSGQLLYHGPKTSLIGDVFVRFSRKGDFELTFTKGPGVSLLVVRQDATSARAEGPLARGRWSGLVDQAPKHLRGWLRLRDSLLRSPSKQIISEKTEPETFLLRF